MEHDRAGPACRPDMLAGSVNGVKVPAGDYFLRQQQLGKLPLGAAEQDQSALPDGDAAAILCRGGIEPADIAAAEVIDEAREDLAAAQAGQARPATDERAVVLIAERGGGPARTART